MTELTLTVDSGTVRVNNQDVNAGESTTVSPPVELAADHGAATIDVDEPTPQLVDADFGAVEAWLWFEHDGRRAAIRHDGVGRDSLHVSVWDDQAAPSEETRVEHDLGLDPEEARAQAAGWLERWLDDPEDVLEEIPELADALGINDDA